MKSLFVRLLKDEQGQDLVEYALIVAAVGLALITTVNQLSQGIVSLYSSITMLVSQALDWRSRDLFSSRQTKPESRRAIHPCV